MDLEVERVDVWAAPIRDERGALAALLEGLHKAGADLQLIIARRAPEAPGTGVLFVTPLQGERETLAAAQLGFSQSQSLRSVRIRGRDRAGVCALLVRALADGGINLRGISSSTLGSQFISYLSLDSSEDADKAIDILQGL